MKRQLLAVALGALIGVGYGLAVEATIPDTGTARLKALQGRAEAESRVELAPQPHPGKVRPSWDASGKAAGQGCLPKFQCWKWFI
jgi:hypothetical protein